MSWWLLLVAYIHYTDGEVDKLITLNGERGFVHVETWEEVLALPGFQATYESDELEIEEVIGRYSFSEKVNCGLKGCRTPHNKGYIVSSKSGVIANIGNVCGRKILGVVFDEIAKDFDRRISDHQNRETISAFVFQIEGAFAELSSLREGAYGGNWAYSTTRMLVSKGKGCPDVVVSLVSGMMLRRDSGIYEETEIAEDELIAQEVATGKKLRRPQFLKRKLGSLRGIECLFPEYNIRNIAVRDLDAHLKELVKFDISTATSRELKDWSKWCGEYDQKKRMVISSISKGLQLMEESNLLKLTTCIDRLDDRKKYKQWVRKHAVQNPVKDEVSDVDYS